MTAGAANFTTLVLAAWIICPESVVQVDPLISSSSADLSFLKHLHKLLAKRTAIVIATWYLSDTNSVSCQRGR